MSNAFRAAAEFYEAYKASTPIALTKEELVRFKRLCALEEASDGDTFWKSPWGPELNALHAKIRTYVYTHFPQHAAESRRKLDMYMEKQNALLLEMLEAIENSARIAALAIERGRSERDLDSFTERLALAKRSAGRWRAA